MYLPTYLMYAYMLVSQVQSGPHVHASKRDPNVYDNSNLSAEVLRGFWRAHKDLLRTIPMVNVQNLLKYRDDFAKFDDVWKRVASLPGRFVILLEILWV